MIFCTKCGAQAPDGSSVCPNCGSALFEGQPNQQAQYQQPYGQYGPPARDSERRYKEGKS